MDKLPMQTHSSLGLGFQLFLIEAVQSSVFCPVQRCLGCQWGCERTGEVPDFPTVRLQLDFATPEPFLFVLPVTTSPDPKNPNQAILLQKLGVSPWCGSRADFCSLPEWDLWAQWELWCGWLVACRAPGGRR